MILKDYRQFGGVHWESAAIQHLCAYHDVTAPHTGKPPSEALCFGVAGGIGIGYSFCPSVPGHNTGSGVSIVGRHKMYSTAGVFVRDAFDRLGLRTDVRETGGLKAADKNLTESLEAGKPVIVWCGPLRETFRHDWTCVLWVYLTVVYGVDPDNDVALLADCAPTPLEISLGDLAERRNRVCSLKNRSLTLESPKPIAAAQLKSAVRAGLKACADELLKPRMKTFGFPGLIDWSKMLVAEKNKKGWPVVFKGGRLYQALRDVFDSIETSGTGGGAYRLLFADFLDEAGKILGSKALGGLAGRYRVLAGLWTDLAEAALPDRVKPFKQTKALLRKRNELFLSKGVKAAAQMRKGTDELIAIEKSCVAKFPLGDKERAELLQSLAPRVVELHDAELETAEALAKAIK